jgi:predicted transcriptional regulator
MTSDSTEKLSMDESILDFLSKKAVADQTEKLALARISGKMETSVEEVGMSISRLQEKHLIRKISWQGKVSFELTPKGKSAIEALAKAQTDRVTKQLQEAIHQERKVKLRASIVKKMKSNEEKWRSYHVPDKKLMGAIEQETAALFAATKEVERARPLCSKDPQNYDQKFSQYKPQVESLIEKNRSLNRTVGNYAKIKSYAESLSADIEKISRTISRYEPMAEAAVQVSQLKEPLLRLKAVQSQLDSFGKDELARFEELEIKLADNAKCLETLKKPTHEFKPIKRDTLSEKATQYLSPEGPVKYESKTSGHIAEEKCVNCGAKRTSTPVTIG